MPLWLVKLIILLSVTALFWWGAAAWWSNTKKHWYDAGYAQAMTDVEVAKAKAEVETKEKQAAIRKDTKKRKQAYDYKDDRPVGPLLDGYFSGLRTAD